MRPTLNGVKRSKVLQTKWPPGLETKCPGQSVATARLGEVTTGNKDNKPKAIYETAAADSILGGSLAFPSLCSSSGHQPPDKVSFSYFSFFLNQSLSVLLSTTSRASVGPW